MADEKELRERVDRNPDDAEALRELADLVGRERDRKAEAVALWQRHVEAADEEDRGDALLALARAQVEARREADAIETLSRCAETDPSNAEAFDLRGELLRRAGRLEEAVEVLRRALELDPDAVRPRIALVSCYDGLGRDRDAEAALDAIREMGSDNPALGALVQALLHRRS